MKKSVMKYIMIVMIGLGLVVGSAQACVTTFINDSNNKIAVLNKNDEIFTVLNKNSSRRFGNKHTPAHFIVYYRQPKKQMWDAVYECIQKECASNGNAVLKCSDLEQNTQATKMFLVSKKDRNASMVHEIPMMKRRNNRA
jgi:hypothetical protein